VDVAIIKMKLIQTSHGYCSILQASRIIYNTNLLTQYSNDLRNYAPSWNYYALTFGCVGTDNHEILAIDQEYSAQIMR
jgi:hypothetical protein